METPLSVPLRVMMESPLHSLIIGGISTGDMGLDAAIFEPNTGFIFGVRSQWLFKFDGTSGGLLDSLRFASVGQSASGIVTIGGKLYISTMSPMFDTSSHPPTNPGDVYVVDASTFAVIGPWGFPTVSGTDLIGIRAIATDGAFIYLSGAQVSSPATDSLFTVNPASLATFSTGHPFGIYWDVVYDSGFGVIWAPDAEGDIVAVATDFSNFCDTTTTLGAGNSPVGITYNSAQAKIYCARGSQYLWKVNPASALPGFSNFTSTSIDTTRATSLAYRLKSVNGLAGNPYNGKILIPTYSDDCVLVWDPASDTLSSTKTGFTSPIDIVNTPTKSFAVQNGLIGLREIV